MVPVGARLWKLSSGGAGGLGLSCTEAGLFLGGTALVERRELGYEPRPAAELERLLARAYGGELTLDRVLPGCQVVAAALEQGNLCLAQIAALHLRIPSLMSWLGAA
ncbi:MAG: hypothetical protein JO007_05525 [Alphaproteobacteria bacterium]|nr:hypothetical protein [Alphaproteobacteria bacterium]